MSDAVPSQPVEAWQTFRPLVEEVTTRFPISQAVPSLADTFDWLLDRATSAEDWLKKQQSLEVQFFERWEHLLFCHSVFRVFCHCEPRESVRCNAE